MRILAIRGENLASLAAPFEIDLAAEPLAGSGLFAITGETGAGNRPSSTRFASRSMANTRASPLAVVKIPRSQRGGDLNS